MAQKRKAVKPRIKRRYKKKTVSRTKRRPGYVKSRRTGRMVKKIVVKRPGSLRAVGYGMKKSATARKAALRRAVKRYGKTKVRQKLGALRAWNARRPHLRKVADADYRFVSGL